MTDANALIRLVNTVRHLKPVQITNRVTRRLARATPRTGRAPPERAMPGAATAFVPRPPMLTADGGFDLLNQVRRLDFPRGWDDPAVPLLWRYTLHYFEWLLASELPPDAKQATIERWLADNPPAKGTGWAPYPLSLRISNWVKYLLQGGTAPPGMLDSLAAQARHLSASVEYHLLGNHLFANAKALMMAGSFFAGDEGDAWLARGARILAAEIGEQFLPDGGHFELSPTYHALLIEDVMDLINVAMRSGRAPDPAWRGVAERGLAWLDVMTRPDGRPPLFNDAAYGVAPTLSDLRAYARRLGVERARVARSRRGLIDLPDSGYFRFNGEGYCYFGDAGAIGPRYLPGHGHCDMLSFELFAAGRPVIVDTGVSTYEGGERRELERSTSAHNSVMIDDNEQSEIWASFRVARRARIADRTVGGSRADATRAGYRAGERHRRIVDFEDRALRIEDRVSRSPARAWMHLHPAIVPAKSGSVVRAGPITIEVENAEVMVKPYLYAAGFNQLVPAKMLELRFAERMACTISL